MLKRIDSNILAQVPEVQLDEIIRKSELLVGVQVDNFRAIDQRAARIMTAVGLFISIIFGILKAGNKSLTNIPSDAVDLLVVLTLFAGVLSVLFTLIIIQSDQIHPTGNDGVILLIDVSDLYSSHEQKVDYIIGLSECRALNETLIERNGRLLKGSSYLLFAMITMLSFAAILEIVL